MNSDETSLLRSVHRLPIYLAFLFLVLMGQTRRQTISTLVVYATITKGKQFLNIFQTLGKGRLILPLCIAY
jgi:hypothetical protein